MNTEVDWRHWMGAGLLAAGLMVLGWIWLMRPAPLPNARAPAGANPRMQDAPEHVPAQGEAPAQPGLPAAR